MIEEEVKTVGVKKVNLFISWALILIGIFFVFKFIFKIDFIKDINFNYIWPIALLILGTWLLNKDKQSKEIDKK